MIEFKHNPETLPHIMGEVFFIINVNDQKIYIGECKNDAGFIGLFCQDIYECKLHKKRDGVLKNILDTNKFDINQYIDKDVFEKIESDMIKGDSKFEFFYFNTPYHIKYRDVYASFLQLNSYKFYNNGRFPSVGCLPENFDYALIEKIDSILGIEVEYEEEDNEGLIEYYESNKEYAQDGKVYMGEGMYVDKYGHIHDDEW